MAEVINLTTPITKPNTTVFSLKSLYIDVASKSIRFEWLGNNGEPNAVTYETPAPSGSSQPSGAALLTTLNKMNFAGGNPSLVSRIFTRLQTDGYIGAGTISGTPD